MAASAVPKLLPAKLNPAHDAAVKRMLAPPPSSQKLTPKKKRGESKP